MDKLYLTTPIYYVNGDPHIGHAHTSVVGDALRRLALMRGEESFFTTGTDEHGQKNQQAAEESGLPTAEFLARQSQRFRALFDRLEVKYDHFVRTTDPAHKAAVGAALQRLWDSGLIVKKQYRGLYCVGCEQFKLERDLDEEGRCPDHLLVPVPSEEVNYFLRLAPFQEWLTGFLQSRDDLIEPEFFRREVLAMLQEPLEDLSISRPKERVALGVELPFDPEYVTYVWFDALLNYVSSLGWPERTPEFERWWPAATHLMAKDIIKTHCIYWPIILKALEVEPPAGYRVHGYWVGEGGRKMSKTLGNVVEPNQLIDLVGVDGLRYYLLRYGGSTDSPISNRLVVTAYNSELANNLGNLFSRVLRFTAATGKVPSPASLAPDDERLVREAAETAARVLDEVDFVGLQQLPRSVIEIASALNAHIESIAPWHLARDPAQKERLDSVIYATMEALRIVAELVWPVMPGTANRALALLGAEPIPDAAHRHEFVPFRLQKGKALEAPSSLFPRVKVD